MSNNTINYTIYKDGEPVGYHTQNVMCRRCNDGLMKFQPAKDYTIVYEGYEDHYDDYFDDEESDYFVDPYEDSEPVEVNLEEWLRKNPPEFTHRKFEVGDKVKLSKKRGEATVKESKMLKFFPEYKVELPNGDLLDVQQNEVLPFNN